MDLFEKKKHVEALESGTMTRKQTHLHKLAMILSVAEDDSLVIDERHLKAAHVELEALEKSRIEVFRNIGRTAESSLADRMISTVKSRGPMPIEELYREFHSHIPNFTEFDSLFRSCAQAGHFSIGDVGGVATVSYRPPRPRQ
jgi:hypothetical protein